MNMADLELYVCDSDFETNKLDAQFKIWTSKEITSLCKMIKDRTLISSETLKKEYLLRTGFLPLRHYIKNNSEK